MKIKYMVELNLKYSCSLHIHLVRFNIEKLCGLLCYVNITVFGLISQYCEKRLLVTSCLSVQPSVRMEQLGSHWTNFNEI